MVSGARVVLSMAIYKRRVEEVGMESTVGMLVGLSVGFSFLLGLTAPAVQALDVVGCLYDNTNVQIDDDPNTCPPEQRLDLVSIKTSWTNTPTNGGGSGGRVEPEPFVLVKRLDRTSPQLFFHVATGRHLDGALIVLFDQLRGQRAQRLFSILLVDVVVTSLEASAADSPRANAETLEMVQLRYATITLRDDVSGEQTPCDFLANSCQ
jgi:type VI secretion system Hcp family effector